MRESRGSGTAPGSLAEAIRLGTAPAAIVLVTPDLNLAIGARSDGGLYGRGLPVVTVTEDQRSMRSPKRLSSPSRPMARSSHGL